MSSSSSSSCRAGSADIPDPLSPLFPIVHRLRAGLLDNIPYPHIAAECMFVLVVLLLHGHVWGSIRVHHLWVSSLLLQHCPACLVRLSWIVFVIGGRWPYSWCLVVCCRQDLFKIARSIYVHTSPVIYVWLHQFMPPYFTSTYLRLH